MTCSSNSGASTSHERGNQDSAYLQGNGTQAIPQARRQVPPHGQDPVAFDPLPFWVRSSHGRKETPQSPDLTGGFGRPTWASRSTDLGYLGRPTWAFRSTDCGTSVDRLRQLGRPTSPTRSTELTHLQATLQPYRSVHEPPNRGRLDRLTKSGHHAQNNRISHFDIHAPFTFQSRDVNKGEGKVNGR